MAYVTMTSILSGSITTRQLDVDEDQYELWKLNRTSGLPCKMVQDEFPHLNASDRDFLDHGDYPAGMGSYVPSTNPYLRLPPWGCVGK